MISYDIIIHVYINDVLHNVTYLMCVYIYIYIYSGAVEQAEAMTPPAPRPWRSASPPSAWDPLFCYIYIYIYI